MRVYSSSGNLELDYSSPLVVAPNACFVGRTELVQRFGFTEYASGSTAQDYGPSGPCLETHKFPDWHTFNKPVTLPPVDGWTIAAITAPYSTGTICGIMEQPFSGTYDRSITSNGPWMGYVYDNTPTNVTATTVAVAGRFDKVIVTCSTSTMCIYVNGKFENSCAVTNSGYRLYSSPEFGVGCAAAEGACVSSAKTVLAYFDNSVWQPGQASIFFDRPWSLFKRSISWGYTSMGSGSYTPIEMPENPEVGTYKPPVTILS
jgi:hypothetical protein